ncbi:MAG: DegV family protein [Bacillota bacterium]|nr:DegV family protein [Bacillota bacterium]
MSIGLVADSCCDTDAALRDYLRADYVPLRLNIGERHWVDDLDMDPMEVLREMKTSTAGAGSSCPPVGEYLQQIERQLQQHQDCFVVTLSSRLSSSYSSAQVAREMILEKQPGRRIHVVDSLSASAGVTQTAYHLRKFIDMGLEFEQIIERINAYIKQQRTLFVLEDLSNFVKTGRLSKVKGMITTTFKLFPIMSDNGDGEVIMAVNVKGLRRSLSKLAEIIAADISKFTELPAPLCICHSNCPERAQKLRDDVLALCPDYAPVLIIPMRGIATLFANDGGICVAY